MTGRRLMGFIALALLGLLTAALVTLWVIGAERTRAIENRFPATGETLTVSGTQLHYERSAQADAPVVLVLHGASSNLREPKLALESALEAYDVIWLDRPGLGWSERPNGGGDWTPEREAALINAFLAALGEEEVFVIGHSWGSAISLRLLMDHSNRMAGAVLVAPAARAHVGDAAYYNHLTGWPVLGPIMSHIVVPLIGPGGLQSGSVSAFSPAEPPAGYIENTHLPLILRPSNWRANAADMARVNISLEEQEVRYHEIVQPVIIVAAPADTVVFTERHARPVAETVQNGELRLIEGEGHNPHHGHPESVAAALGDVIARANDTAAN